jgi:hypothetical protein
MRFKADEPLAGSNSHYRIRKIAEAANICPKRQVHKKYRALKLGGEAIYQSMKSLFCQYVRYGTYQKCY